MSRPVPELINALRVRANLISGESWEVSATVEMMKEAADALESLQKSYDLADRLLSIPEELIAAVSRVDE